MVHRTVRDSAGSMPHLITPASWRAMCRRRRVRGIRGKPANSGLIDTQIARDVVAGDERAYAELAGATPSIAWAGPKEPALGGVAALRSRRRLRHFTREYKRLFGKTPGRDLRGALRGGAILGKPVVGAELRQIPASAGAGSRRPRRDRSYASSAGG